MLPSESDRPPPPLLLDGVRYQQECSRDAQDPHGVHLAAYDEATGECLWTVPVFSPGHDADSPFGYPAWNLLSIEALPGGRALRLEARHGPGFVLDLETRVAERVGTPEPAAAPVPVAGLDIFLGLVDPLDAPDPLQDDDASGTDGRLPCASRGAPPEVRPVVHDGVLYEQLWDNDVPGIDDQTTYLVARDARTMAPLWTVALYRIELIPDLETDVQDVFLRSLALSADGRGLVAEDERGRRFEIDLATRTSREVGASPR